MKHRNNQGVVLFTIGSLLMSVSFILQRVIVVTDTLDGFLKGAAIGFMMLSLLGLMKKNRVRG